MAEPKQGGDATAFIQEYGPIAEKIGADIGVDPKIILAKFGLETGWGKSVIPGTYNLGNIKDFSGAGVKAYDKREKSNDAYMKFEDPETFAAYYSDFMKRMYPKAIGAGSDVDAFTSGLNKGVRGPYATAENYPSAIRNAYSLVNARMESAQPAPAAQEENPFGSGPTEAQRILQEPERKVVVEGEREGMSGDDAALYGAGAGLGAGIIAKNTKLPTSPRYDAAVERLRVAQDKLTEVQSRAGSGVSVDDLEKEFRMRQMAATQAAQELKAAEAELKTLNKAPAPSVSSAAGELAEDVAGASRKVPGASGASNWVRAMGQDVPDVLAETAENMRKDNPKGGQAIIDRDVAAKQKIQQMGAGDYKLVGQGKGQLMLPPELAAEKTAALETELTQRQTADAAERTRLESEAQSKRIAAENRAELARQQRQRAGLARRDADQAVKQARTAQGQVQRAQSGVNVAQQAVERAGAAKPGALGQVGAFTAKVAPKAIGVISGAATGLSAMEAIDKFKKGDYSGAVLPTLEATFGVMSMLPPAHPVLLALRGLGTLGGTALAGYEGYKAVRGEPQTEE
jgi:hypothetical protein